MSSIVPLEKIENKILLIRDQKVMLDRDLAKFYGVETKVLNQAVKRNIKRFPDDFMFQLTRMEAEFLALEGYLGEASRSQFVTLNNKDVVISQKNSNLRSQFVTLNKTNKRGFNIKHLPYVFTEQGVAMLSSVLKIERAVEINIIIMRAFIKIRKLVYSYKDLADKIAKIEREHGNKIGRIFQILDSLVNEKEEGKKKKKEIGFRC